MHARVRVSHDKPHTTQVAPTVDARAARYRYTEIDVYTDRYRVAPTVDARAALHAR